MKTNVVKVTTPITAHTLLIIREIILMLGSAPE